jgi:hypothetical protein
MQRRVLTNGFKCDSFHGVSTGLGRDQGGIPGEAQVVEVAGKYDFMPMK